MTIGQLLWESNYIPECLACRGFPQVDEEIVVLNNPGSYGKMGAYIHVKCVDTPEGQNYSERLKEIG